MDLLSAFKFAHSTQSKLLGSPWGVKQCDVVWSITTKSAKTGRGFSLSPTDAWYHHQPTPLTLRPEATASFAYLPCFSSPLLDSWDHLMMAIVSRITDINFKQNNTSWSQATLPGNLGGFGFRSTSNHCWPIWHMLMESLIICISSYPPSC